MKFGLRHVSDDLASSNKLIIIAFIPRSGSNYLCDLMLRTGGFGIPLEYYYPFEFEARRKRFSEFTGASYIDPKLVPDEISWFKQVLLRSSVKCSYISYETMVSEAGELYRDVDECFIYLRRRDKLMQAISWHRAVTTGKWACDFDEHSKPVYDRGGIEEKLHWIDWHEEQWERILGDTRRLDIFYEDICDGTLDEIERFTGLSRESRDETGSYFTILRDEINYEWRDRFLRGL